MNPIPLGEAAEPVRLDRTLEALPPVAPKDESGNGDPPPPVITASAGNQISLFDLRDLLEPIVRHYIDTDNEKHKRAHDYDTKVLEHAAAQIRRLTYGAFALVGGLLLFAAYMALRGELEIAGALIAGLVGLGGAGALGRTALPQRRPRESQE